MYELSVNIIERKDPHVFVNIYETSKKEASKLFCEEYKQDVLDLELFFPEAITGAVEICLEENDNLGMMWISVNSFLKDTDKLLQVFADEEIKNEIIRKAFEYV